MLFYDRIQLEDPGLREPYRQPVGPVSIDSDLISGLGLRNVYFPRGDIRSPCLVTREGLITSGTRTPGLYGVGTAYAAEAYYTIPNYLPGEATLFSFFHAKVTDNASFSYGIGALRNAAGFRAIHITGQNKAIDNFKITFAGNTGSKTFTNTNLSSGDLDGGNYFVVVTTRKSTTEHYFNMVCLTDCSANFADSDLATSVVWTVSPLTRFYPVGNGGLTGEVLLSGWADKYWPQAQVREFLRDPYSIFRQAANIRFLGTAGGGGVTLIVQDALHAQAADNVDLTQANTLSIDDAVHAHTADNIALSMAISLAVADSLHSQTADNVDLVQANLLAIDDATHAHTVDNVDLTQASVLTVNGALHSHTADNVTLDVSMILDVSDAAHDQSADNVDLVQANILSVLDTVHAQTADNIDLITEITLIVSDALHAHLADNIALSMPGAAVTPDGRVITIQAQDRAIVITTQDRVFNIN